MFSRSHAPAWKCIPTNKKNPWPETVKRNSVFLFGPRQVGKTTLIKHLFAEENYIEIEFLKNEVLLKYKTNPVLLRSEIEFLAGKKERIYVFIIERT